MERRIPVCCNIQRLIEVTTAKVIAETKAFTFYWYAVYTVYTSTYRPQTESDEYVAREMNGASTSHFDF